jgi:hypothetical protein
MMPNIIFDEDPEEKTHTDVLDESIDNQKMRKTLMFPKLAHIDILIDLVKSLM